jgi:hypothetical protein
LGELVNLVIIPEKTRPTTMPEIKPETVIETAVALRWAGARSAVSGFKI